MSLAKKMARLPVSESAATVQASGAEPGWVSSAVLATAESAGNSAGALNAGDEDNLSPLGAPALPSSGAIGLDLSSSRGGGVAERIWGLLRRGDALRGPAKLRQLVQVHLPARRRFEVRELAARPPRAHDVLERRVVLAEKVRRGELDGALRDGLVVDARDQGEVAPGNAGRGHRAERLGGALGATRARVAFGFASARENHDTEQAEAAQAGKRRRLGNARRARALDAAALERKTRGASQEVRRE